jgi:hypothetical protein
MKTSVVCTEFRPIDGGKLAGFAKIRLAELRMTISNIPIWKNESGYSASSPSVPMFRDGQPIKESAGKTKYQVILSFDNAEIQQAFADRVVAAVRAYDPRALP